MTETKGLIVSENAPVLQVYDEYPAPASRVTNPGLFKDVGFCEIVGDGAGFTVTVTQAVPVQPLPEVTVTQ